MSGLTREQQRMLRAIGEMPAGTACSPYHLAGQINTTTGGALRVLRRLRAKGLVDYAFESGWFVVEGEPSVVPARPRRP